MAKSSKKAPVKTTKPITEFFTRKAVPTTPNSSQPKLSQVVSTDQSEQGLSEKATKTHLAPHIVHTISTDSIATATATRSDASNLSLKAKPRTFMEAVEIVSPRRQARSNGSCTPNLPIVSLNSMLNTNGPLPRSKSTSLARRKSKFDSDSDVEKLESIVYISKSPLPPGSTTSIRASAPLMPKENFSLPTQPNARKKPRLSSPDPGVKSVLGDVVPSSQSDEQEMMSMRLLQRDPASIKQHVDEWRQMAVPSIPAVGTDAFPDEMQMDIDPSPSSPLSSSHSSPGSAMDDNPEPRNSRAYTPVSPMFGHEDAPLIPRTSSFSPLPPSPVALDPETKTAMIIAKIREKAYADNVSSPLDSPTMEFKDELEDSSDDEDIVLWSPPKGKGKLMNPIMAPQPSPISNRRSGRLSRHNAELSPSPSHANSSVHSRRTRTVPNRGPVVLTQGVPTKKRKGKSFDPLDELLKEKKLADKRGKGDTAFRLAEGAIAGKDAMMDEMNLENASADWSNEEAARIAVEERAQIDMKSLSPVASGSGGDVMLTAQDPERLLGEKHGKAVVDILDGDRKKRQVEKAAEKVHGITLWSEPSIDDEMAVDQVFPVLMNTGNNSLVHSLSTAIENQDFSTAILLLDSGSFTFINLTENPSVIPYLCLLALSSHETSLNNSAFRLLCHIWDTTTQAVPGLSFDMVLVTLVKLGVKLPILSSFGWDVDQQVRPEIVGLQQRDEVLYHLIGLITSSARSGRLPSEQAPDMVMAMLVIGHDTTTSPQLYREIVLAIDEVCRSIAPGDKLFKSLEATICTKILHYATAQTPVNKAFIMNILAAGTERTRRIARWTAHALVTRSTIISPVSYCDLPPLLPVLDQLRYVTDRDSTESPGMFELHDNTDYVDLGFHVQVLAVAVSKVRAYVEQERIARRTTPADSIKPEDTPETMIQMVHQAIEKKHSSISDVRAAHLDRSRAKAALKELSMRIHYQILSSRGGGTGLGKPRNLRQYFGTKN